VAYDQKFHAGVNIIRGENSSGKSTVSDFIFYILGGEFEEWKEAARQCDEVQAEISTPSGKLTLIRTVDTKITPIRVFFGDYETAKTQSLDTWETFPIHRISGGKESFSQVLFRSLKIPEAQSDEASNITMHQLLRLLYADQRTPAPRLFRFESFDTRNIRNAVGDLVCGIGGYELYEINLKLRSMEDDFKKLQRRYTSIIEALPLDETFFNADAVTAHINDLEQKTENIRLNIEGIDDLIDDVRDNSFADARREASRGITKKKSKLDQVDARVKELEYENIELSSFIDYLAEQCERIKQAESSMQAFGAVEFTHCPACLTELSSLNRGEHDCGVCGAPIDMETEKAKYNHVRLDIEIQLREANQLIVEKRTELDSSKRQSQVLFRELKAVQSDFEIKFDSSSSPREKFLTMQGKQLGELEAEIRYYQQKMDLALELQKLFEQKDELQNQINSFNDRKTALEISANQRKRVAKSLVSDIAAKILRADKYHQPEFENADSVEIRFGDDAVLVEGKMNFAESSNVWLKNAAILSLFLAAGNDPKFYHPRFALFDNIEDKGMVPKRSHQFQRLLVETVTELNAPYQVIYTTSMMNPELELEDYVIGPAYTPDNRTLDLGY
jgi:hypothetical protein